MASTVCTVCKMKSVQCMTSEGMRCIQLCLHTVLMQALQHAAVPYKQVTPGPFVLQLTLSEKKRGNLSLPTSTKIRSIVSLSAPCTIRDTALQLVTPCYLLNYM